jgi:hypothetical protein
MRILVTALAATALLAGCGKDDKATTSTTPTAAKPNSVATTPAALKALAKQVGHDIYWAGPRKGYTYELTRTKTQNTFIRYLPPGVPVGSPSPDFLSVGTYEQADAFKTIQTARKRKGEQVDKLDGGGYAVSAKERPQSVYFSYPGSTLLVEVYDPSPLRARKLVTTGQVKPIR